MENAVIEGKNKKLLLKQLVYFVPIYAEKFKLTFDFTM